MFKIKQKLFWFKNILNHNLATLREGEGEGEREGEREREREMEEKLCPELWDICFCW